MKPALLFLILATIMPLTLSGKTSPFEKAKKLYKQGPTKAGEVISLLNEELKDHPDNLEAMHLLGITHFGMGQFDQAIPWFDKMIQRGLTKTADGKIHAYPRVMLLKIKALFYQEKLREAKSELRKWFGFLESNSEIKSETETFRKQINYKLQLLFVDQTYHMLGSKGIHQLDDYLFIPFDGWSIETVKKDQDLGPWSVLLGEDRDECVVLVTPRGPGDLNSYAVHLVKDQPVGWVNNPPTKDKADSQTKAEQIKKNYQTLATIDSANHNAESHKWISGEVKLDDGTPFTAFSLPGK